MSAVKNKAIIIFIVVAVLAGQLWYNQARLSRVFYLISLLVAVGAVLMFYLSFESKRPKERELVLVCVLCAVAVASRAVFFMLPQIKPMAAIVILCAVCYGKEMGFLIGSMSILLSNFLFGHGPFTPFGMLGMGLVGYIAGVLFFGKKTPLWVLCIYGFISVYFLYGGIMNWSTILLYTEDITFSYVATIFGLAIYFDILHSLSTAVFLALMNRSFSFRMERVKRRYGMLR